MKEQIFFKGVEYNLDAVLLANWNIGIGHAIAGITCKKKKYIYNGWTRTSMDPSMINQLHQLKRKMRQDYYKNIIILLFILSIGVNDRI